VDVGQHAAIEWHDVADTRSIQLEAADDGLVAPLQDANDAPLGPAGRLPLDAGDHAVAVHRFEEIAGGNVDITAHAAHRRHVFRHDEAESAGIRVKPSDDEVHLLGEPKAIAANLEEHAFAGECFQLPLERRAILTRNAKELREFTGAGRMMNLVADESE
jgi:hypothetical protein